MASFAAPDRRAPTWFGHPPGLFLLFFAELWERFSYYGMRALLVFYLTKHFLFADKPAYALYGAYTSLIYITPVLGGIVADRYLGARKAVLAGGVLIALGHLGIALTEARLEGFYVALAAIIVGTGFLKANVASLVGALYPRDDARRDPAFSIFYMGINLGGAIGPIVCGWLGERVGWGWGFGAAAVGMLLGLVAFVWRRPLLEGRGEPPRPALLAERTAFGISREGWIYLAAAAGVVPVWALVRSPATVGTLLLAFAAVTVGYVLWRAWQLGRIERHRIFALLFLMALNPLFWGLFEQAGSSLNTFTDRHVDRHLLGWEVPASLFQSINSIFIILFAPLFAALWTGLGRRGLEPSTTAKFGIGLILTGAGFLVLVAGSQGGGLTPVGFIVLLYLFHTLGELAFSPVGMSATSRLSVPAMAGLMMGSWYLAMAGGNFAAGRIAVLTGGVGGEARVLEVYWRIGWVAAVVGVIVIAVSPLVTRLMHLDELSGPPVDHGLAGEAGLAEAGATGTRLEGETIA